MKSHFLSVASRLLFKILSVYRSERRFAAALKIARVSAPVLERLKILPAPPFCLNNYQGYLLSYILSSMTYQGLEFDPVITVRGAKELKNGRAIIVTGHYYLNMIFSRWLYDNDHLFSSIMLIGHDEWKIAGTKIPFEVIHPFGKSLLKIRRRLADGHFVIVPIDSSHPYPGWHKVNTADRDLFVSNDIINFASRINVPILFLKTQMNARHEIVVEIVRSKSTNNEIVFEDFCQFLVS